MLEDGRKSIREKTINQDHSILSMQVQFRSMIPKQFVLAQEAGQEFFRRPLPSRCLAMRQGSQPLSASILSSSVSRGMPLALIIITKNFKRKTPLARIKCLRECNPLNTFAKNHSISSTTGAFSMAVRIFSCRQKARVAKGPLVQRCASIASGRVE